MRGWPKYLEPAARQMGYYDDDHSRFKAPVAAFAERWGGFGPDALTRALQMASGDERLFAIWLLIGSAAPQAREVAASFLTPHANQLERWHCAIYLGTIGDARALPTLQAILTESLPAPDIYPAAWQHDTWQHESARVHAAILLGLFGDRTAIPLLRSALQAMAQLETALGHPPSDASATMRRDHDEALAHIHEYQNHLVYALGQLGAVGSLLGVPCDEARLDLWRVHLVMGHFHTSYNFIYVGRFADEPNLLPEIRKVLTETFGLAEDEQTQHLERYEREMLYDLFSFCYALQLARERRIAE